MPFDPNSDGNFAIVKQAVFSQLGNNPITLPNGQGNSNPGERSHGLDTSQVQDFLWRFVEYVCSQNGATINSTLITNATAAARASLVGKRSF